MYNPHKENQKYEVTFKNMTVKVESQHAQTWGAFISRYGEGSGSGNAGKLIIDNCVIEVRGTIGSGAISTNNYGVFEIKNTSITSNIPLLYDHDDNAVITASNSSAVAVSAGELPTVDGLTFNNPFNLVVEAKIGNVTYLSLEAALMAVEEGQTVTLVKDIDVTTTGTPGRIKCYGGNFNITLDGNGKTITGIADTTLAIHYDSALASDNGGVLNLTIKNLTVGNKLNNAAASATALQVNTSTNVTLVDTTVVADANKWAAVVIQPSGTLNIEKGSKVSCPTGNAILLNGAAATANIYGGTVEANSVLYSRNLATCMNVSHAANLIANGSIISAESTTGTTLNITGGKIKTNATDTKEVAAFLKELLK